MQTFKLTKQFYTEFPDGQKIPTIPLDDYIDAYGDVIEIDYTWKWDTVQVLIGAAKVFKKYGHRIALNMPYMFGSRADRAFELTQPNYFRDVIAPIINSLGFEYVRCLDPHSDVVEACIPNLRIDSLRPFHSYVARSLPHPTCMVVPDAGAVKKSYASAGLFPETIYATKHRDVKTGQILETKLDRLPEGIKHFCIVDDICDGGATFIGLARVIKEKCPDAILYLCVTHGLFSKGLETLLAEFRGIYYTDSTLPNKREGISGMAGSKGTTAPDGELKITSQFGVTVYPL